MKFLDLTLQTAQENLAVDEALLENADAGNIPNNILRIWEPSRPLVVIGRSSRVAEEVNIDFCREREIPILRRCSGGAAVVTGVGCLMYAVVLDYQSHPQLRALDVAHHFVMQTNRAAIRALGIDVQCDGTCDLTLNNRKCSGNSLRCKRDHLLYHGTMLYRFDLDLITHCLRWPPRQPDYRQGRNHRDFVTNLPTTSQHLRTTLKNTWQANELYDGCLPAQTKQLVQERYSQREWNERF